MKKYRRQTMLGVNCQIQVQSAKVKNAKCKSQNDNSKCKMNFSPGIYLEFRI